MHKLSIIIPVYNEEQTVVSLVNRVQQVKLPNLRKEIIIVNDGSTDSTKEKLSRFKGSEIKIYNSVLNLGKGAAVRLGLAKSTGDYLIIQDADLELDPEEYSKLLSPLLLGKAKVVYGSRFNNSHNRIPHKTRLANFGLTLLTNLLFGSHLTDMETAYKAFKKEAISGIKLKALEFEFEPEITARILQKGLPITEVPISYQPRTTKEGKHIKFKDGLEAVYTLFRCAFFK